MEASTLINPVSITHGKVVVCGLNNSGKSTLISFMETGGFQKETPTMGKTLTSIIIQGSRIDLIELGGHEEFRGLWRTEMSDSDCIVFVLDASDKKRFTEAKVELLKHRLILSDKPLIVLANKQDLGPEASIGEIIETLELSKLNSFEIYKTSCKNGSGILETFSKMLDKIKKRQSSKKIIPEALSIFNQGGVMLTTTRKSEVNQEVLRGGLFSAIASFIRESYNSELSQIKLKEHLILFKRTEHLMGSIVIKNSGKIDTIDTREAELLLVELLQHLESKCPELNAREEPNPEKIEELVQQFSTSIFN